MKQQTKSQPSTGFEFWYPAHNRIDLPIEWVPHRLQVHSIQTQHIVDVDEFFRQPMLRYGCTLITGTDQFSEIRTIYLEAVSDRELPRLRLVLINPEEDDTPEPISELFEQTVDDRQQLLERAGEFFIPQGLKLAVQLV